MGLIASTSLFWFSAVAGTPKSAVVVENSVTVDKTVPEETKKEGSEKKVIDEVTGKKELGAKKVDEVDKEKSDETNSVSSSKSGSGSEPESLSSQTFSEWKASFYQYALTEGVSKKTLDNEFVGLKIDNSVIKLISSQPEFTKSIWEYLDTAVSDKRIRRGRKLLALHDSLLKRVEKMYGVQPEYIVAIWGLESSYGNNFGNSNVLRSLASLTYGSKRQKFFQKELVAALKIVQGGQITSQQLKGSWAGAMGHTQFMPSTYEHYAVDFNKDNRKDLWGTLDDVFASTANYLSESGWQAEQAWGIEVELPEKFDWDLASPTTWSSVSEWAKAGLKRADGRPLNSLDEKEARIFLPAGHTGPAFLTFKNFQAIKQYNNANAYALAVGYLGDRIRGGKEIIAKWPRKDAALSHTEKEDLQFLLTELGYDTGGIDGKIGPNTRQALRSWQKDMGIPADGYVNESILELLR